MIDRGLIKGFRVNITRRPVAPVALLPLLQPQDLAEVGNQFATVGAGCAGKRHQQHCIKNDVPIVMVRGEGFEPPASFL